MPDPISHAEMLAAYQQTLADQEAIARVFPDGPAARRLDALRAVMRLLESLIDPPVEIIDAGCHALITVPASRFMEWELSGDKRAMARGKMRARWKAMIERALALPPSPGPTDV